MPAYIAGREEYIIDGDKDEGNDHIQSDLVRILLNLAYLDEEKQDKFQMDKNFVQQHLEKGLFKGLAKVGQKAK